jgi:hypothetical protein
MKRHEGNCVKRFLWLVLGLLIPAVPAWSASFDCGRASTDVGRMICTDPELSSVADHRTQVGGKDLSDAHDSRTFGAVRLAASDPSTAVKSTASDPAENHRCYRLFRGMRFSMCREFENNLNQYCEAPPMLCEIRVAPEFGKDFTFPKWETLDAGANLEMIEKFIRARVSVRSDWIGKPEERSWREKKWKEYEPGLMQRLNEGVIRFSRARVDLNHNGETELVYRLIDRDCPVSDPAQYHFPTGPKLMVLDEATGEFDQEYTKHLYRAYDVLLHQGRAHLSHFGSGDDRVNTALQIYDTVSGPAIGRFATISRPVCAYEYIDQRGQ